MGPVDSMLGWDFTVSPPLTVVTAATDNTGALLTGEPLDPTILSSLEGTPLAPMAKYNIPTPEAYAAAAPILLSSTCTNPNEFNMGINDFTGAVKMYHPAMGFLDVGEVFLAEPVVIPAGSAGEMKAGMKMQLPPPIAAVFMETLAPGGVPDLNVAFPLFFSMEKVDAYAKMTFLFHTDQQAGGVLDMFCGQNMGPAVSKTGSLVLVSKSRVVCRSDMTGMATMEALMDPGLKDGTHPIDELQVDAEMLAAAADQLSVMTGVLITIFLIGLVLSLVGIYFTLMRGSNKVDVKITPSDGLGNDEDK